MLKEEINIGRSMFDFRRAHNISSALAASVLGLTEDEYIQIESRKDCCIEPTYEQFMTLVLSKDALSNSVSPELEKRLVGLCEEVIATVDILADTVDEDKTYEGVFNIIRRNVVQMRKHLLGY